MANTYKALSTVTVGAGGAATIDFTNIPQTYTDLVILTSLKNTSTSPDVAVRINNTSATYTNIYFYNNGNTVSTISDSTGTGFYAAVNRASYGANTFANNSITIPNYANNTSIKTASIDNATEANTASIITNLLIAGRYTGTDPVTRVTLIPGNGTFEQYSTATLYGVFNADVSSAPATPTIGTATAGVGQASVTFTGVSNAASYTMTSTPSSITATGTTSPIVVTGLTADTSYTFKVKSNNPFGSSAESAASNSITALGTAFDSIATVTVGAGGSSTVVFNSIPSTYKHLQIRYIARNSTASTDTSGIGLRMNGDTSSNYAWHSAKGNGTNLLTEAYANNADIGDVGFTIGNTATYFAGAGIVDIVDYANTNKFKTIRTVGGVSYANSNTGPNIAVMSSGLWRNTNAITSLTFNTNGNFQQYSTFALYGVKG